MRARRYGCKMTVNFFDAAGAHLDHSGEGVKTSRETDEKQKKASLFLAGVALSQLSANHAEVYHVFCKK